jgi:hypothetical protein
MAAHYRGGLSGGDAYALRCAYVHEGGGKILYQRARQALTDFYFVVPNEGRGISIHNVEVNSTLILQIDIFCGQMIDAVDKWANDVRTDQAVQERLKSLLEIHETTPAGLAGLGYVRASDGGWVKPIKM